MSELIAAYAAHLRAADMAQRTITAREQLLRRLDKTLPEGLAQAATEELEVMFGQWTGWTLYTYWEHVFSFYAWATRGRRPRLDWNPMEDMRRPRTPQREPRPMTEQEIAVALCKLRDPWRRGVLLATCNGLRCAEVVWLDREHVTEQEMTIRRKGGKTQTLPTHPAVWADLSRLPPGPVVRTGAGTRFNPTHYSGGVSDALTAIGIPEGHLHRFRASFATRLHEQGTPIRVIQKLMGHARLETLQAYIETREEQRRLAVNTLPLPAITLQDAA